MLTAGADGEVQLTDLGSSYGTFVGSGQRLNANSPMTLHRGDTFWLGSKEQMFRITGKRREVTWRSTARSVCDRAKENTASIAAGEIAFRGKELQLPVGTHLMGSQAPYPLGASIGQGGFGVTYAALNCASGERVAIKEYFPIYWSERSDNGSGHSSEERIYTPISPDVKKFLHEAEMIQRVRHLKSIVKVKDFFQANNTAYIVMEYLEGKTLKQLVKSKGRLTVEELWVCCGL